MLGSTPDSEISVSRTPTFDREAVLEAALNLFWKNGYDGTSLIQLERATGLRPGSIYNSFGSKKSMFLKVIDYYIRKVVGKRVTAMTSHPKPLLGIQQFFLTAFNDVPVAQLNGCLLTNTATEVCINDIEIRDAVKEGVAMIESGFLKNLVSAQELQALAKDTNVNTLALHLTSCFHGLEVMARLNQNKKQLRLLSEQALSSVLAKTD